MHREDGAPAGVAVGLGRHLAAFRVSRFAFGFERTSRLTLEPIAKHLAGVLQFKGTHIDSTEAR